MIAECCDLHCFISQTWSVVHCVFVRIASAGDRNSVFDTQKHRQQHNHKTKIDPGHKEIEKSQDAFPRDPQRKAACDLLHGF